MTNKEHLDSLNIEEFARFMSEHARNKCKHCVNWLNWGCSPVNDYECTLGFAAWLNDTYEEE